MAGTGRRSHSAAVAEQTLQDLGWRARLAQYASTRNAVVTPRDGWWPLDDEGEWDALLFSRWPVLGEVVRGPPVAASRESA
jgi:hypothetical protein